MSVSIVRMIVAPKATQKPQKMKKCATPVARLPRVTEAPDPVDPSRRTSASRIVGPRPASLPIRYLRTRCQTPQTKTAIATTAAA